MEEDKRGTVKPVPDDWLQYLNDNQLLTYRRLQGFGYHLKFVRRPLFQRPICVFSDPHATKLFVIDEDGNLTEQVNIPLRKDDS